MRYLLLLLVASSCYAQERPSLKMPDITEVMASRPVREGGDINFQENCKDRLIVDPRAVPAKETCLQFFAISLQPSTQTAFYIWDSTAKDDSLYTVIYTGAREIRTSHRRWWTLFLSKKVKVTKERGLYVAGLPGHTIHWEIK